MPLHPLKIFQIRSVVGSAVFAGAMFFVAGCSSTPPPDPMAEAAESGERPVAMKGQSGFFDGKVEATVTVSRGYNRGPGSAARGKGEGGGSRRYKDASMGGIVDSYPIMSEDASESEQREVYEDLVRLDRARRAAGSPMPPVTLRLKIENRGTEPVDVEVLELNSDLGNFAVRPAKITVANGQSAEADPMVSQLGVTSDEIPLKIVLRVGSKKETQVIAVKSIFTAIEKEKSKK
jgi:hypothetical protein